MHCYMFTVSLYFYPCEPELKNSVGISVEYTDTCQEEIYLGKGNREKTLALSRINGPLYDP